MVEIPRGLAEKLTPLGAHFCLVAKKSKNPNVGGKGWQNPKNLMHANDPKLQAWLGEGGNYGVVGGGGLIILDADIRQIKKLILDKLPRTFTVKSPGSHGWHCYYLCGLERPIRLRDKDKENVGDIQGPGKMVVGPGSIHPNGGVYEIIADVPLAQVTKQQLIEALTPYVVPEKEIIQVEQTARNEKARAKVDLDITQVVPLAGLRKRGNEYFGPHPIHGSKTGCNFWVNLSRNCWHCFRHGSGGGPLLWLAVEEGIIKCEDAGPGALRGEVFLKVKKIAIERGFIKEPKKIQRVELPTSEEVSDVFAYDGDRKFNSRIQIKSLGFPNSRFLNLEFHCRRDRGDSCELCGFNGFVMNFEENFDASAFATYFDTNNPKKAFNVLRQKGIVEGCDHVSAKGTEETAITQTIVSDRVGNEAKAWFVHSEKCDLRKGPNWIFANGWLCRGKYGRIGVLVLEFQGESEVIQPDAKTVEASKEYLRKITTEGEPTVLKIARVMRKKSNLKGKEVTRGYASDLLTVGSPVWTKTPEGPEILAMTSLELGTTTTAKSQRERELILWLKAGKYESGRKTTAGLAAGAEKIEGIGWVLKKGLLVSADLSFVILDNMHPHALDEHIESRRNGIVMLTTIKGQSELWARCRLKLLSNPTFPFDQHTQKCVALKVYDPKLVARFTFVIFTYGVKPDTRYNPEIVTITDEEESLLNATWNVLRWNLSQEITYTVPLELWPKIMKLSKELELKFGNEEIPLFLRANPHKIATLAYCFALFEGAEPTERHIEQAYDWLNGCGEDIQLDEFTALWKEEHALSDEDYKTLAETINKKILEEMQSAGGEFKETDVYGFLEFIARHGQGQMEEIAATLRVSDRTVKRRAREMKGLGLIKSSKDGYFFTVKGVKFWKRWRKEVNGVPDVPVDLKKRGQDISVGKQAELPTGKKDTLTSKSEANKDIGDTLIPSVTDIEALERLEPPDHGVCPLCDQRKELSWHIRTPEGWGPICDSCAAKLSQSLTITKELVFKAMCELTQKKLYATTEELLSETKLTKKVLLKILDDFQRDGKLIQFRPDFWRLT